MCYALAKSTRDSNVAAVGCRAAAWRLGGMRRRCAGVRGRASTHLRHLCRQHSAICPTFAMGAAPACASAPCTPSALRWHARLRHLCHQHSATCPTFAMGAAPACASAPCTPSALRWHAHLRHLRRLRCAGMHVNVSASSALRHLHPLRLLHLRCACTRIYVPTRSPHRHVRQQRRGISTLPCARPAPAALSQCPDRLCSTHGEIRAGPTSESSLEGRFRNRSVTSLTTFDYAIAMLG